MITAHSVAAVRRAEDAAIARLPGGAGDLMAAAARAVSGEVLRLLRESGGVYGARVVLLVGAGSNGGDALLAGAHLARRGVAVTAVLAAATAHAGALAAARSAGVRTVSGAPSSPAPSPPVPAALAAVRAARVVVDGLLGTGGRPGLPPGAAALVEAAGERAVVVAVDLPSGVDADTGAVHGAHVRADVTVTFATAKGALLLPPATAAAGRVVVADIGLGALGPPLVEQLTAADAAALWPVPGREADKYSRGVVGVVAGGSTYTGAAVLCVGGAVHAGAGMVRYVGPAHPTELVRARYPEVVPGDGRVQAWAAGSGLDPDDPDAQGALRHVLEQARDGMAVLLDAGALRGPAGLTAWVSAHGPLAPGTRALITPHAGELARLLTDLGEPTSRPDVTQRPVACARAAARATGACVLLKGATTLVVPAPGSDAAGSGAAGSDAGAATVRAQTDGPGWLGTAGAGDVLAGIAGTLLAAGLDPLDAGSLATAVHGRAAAVASGGGPLRALAVSAAVPGVVAHLLRTGTWPGEHG